MEDRLQIIDKTECWFFNSLKVANANRIGILSDFATS